MGDGCPSACEHVEHHRPPCETEEVSLRERLKGNRMAVHLEEDEELDVEDGDDTALGLLAEASGLEALAWR